MYFWWCLGDYFHGWYKRDVYVSEALQMVDFECKQSNHLNSCDFRTEDTTTRLN